MKSKAPLALMEQMVMLLVFALAAALCLQAFVQSDRLSRESEARAHAAVLCQWLGPSGTTAEIWRRRPPSLQSLTVPMPLRAFPLRSIIPRIGGFPIPGSMRIASGRRKWTVVFPAWDRPG